MLFSRAERFRSRLGWVGSAAVLVSACSAEVTVATPDLPPSGFQCTFPIGELASAAPRDAIPAISDPELLFVGDPGLSYLRNDDRVVSLDVKGVRIAVPLNVLWWHEIVNVTIGLEELAITHCPLTGSSLVFDRGPLGGVEFGVSGLLWHTNLLMYDRTNFGEESLWPQLARGARCGPDTGTELAMLPAIEMRWDEFTRLYPEGFVVRGIEGGIDRSYETYPYGPNYRDLNNVQGVPADADPRRLPKERVLGIPTPSGGIAIPFGELEVLGPRAVVALPEHESVVFWSGNAEAAMAFRPSLDQQQLTFRVDGEQIVDDQTGSTWQIDGAAIAGPLSGTQLQPVAEAHVTYWFGWAAFNPTAGVWSSQ